MMFLFLFSFNLFRNIPGLQDSSLRIIIELVVNVGSKVLVLFIHIKIKGTRTMEWVTKKMNSH